MKRPYAGNPRCGPGFSALCLILLARAALFSAGAVSPDAKWLALPRIESAPIAMTWDTQPRLWLLESVLGPNGRQSRVSVVENSAVEPDAYTLKVYADQLPLATGFEWTEQGILLGTSSELWLLQDTNRDDVADLRKVLVTGFGPPGQIGRLSSFVTGPDSWIYFLNDRSGIVSLEARAEGVTVPPKVGCGVLRYHTGSRRLEIFADGPLYPVGLAFDSAGNLFAATRARESLFFIAPGGNFLPPNSFPPPVQHRLPRLAAIGDATLNRYGACGFSLLPESSVAAPLSSGARLLFTNSASQLVPQIHADGAGFRATALLDPSPVATWEAKGESSCFGPDRSRWIRSGNGIAVVGRGSSAGAVSPASLARLKSSDLVPLLEGEDVWIRGWARRRLIQGASLEDLQAVDRIFSASSKPFAQREALWTLAWMKSGHSGVVQRALGHREPSVRVWGVRLVGEAGYGNTEGARGLLGLAQDRDARVRREVAIAIRRLASLPGTASATMAEGTRLKVLEESLERLIVASAGEGDEVIKVLVTAAFDQLVASDEAGSFEILRRVGDSGMSLSGELLNRTIRRLFDTREGAAVNRGLAFLQEISGDSPALCAAGLTGMMKGQKSSKVWTGYPGVKRLLNRLSATPHAELADAVRQVDAFCGNPGAQNAILAKINDARLPEADRLKAIHFAEVIPSELARAALVDSVQSTNLVSLQLPALEVLRRIGKTEDMEKLVRRWEGLSEDLRQASSEVLVAKTEWVPVLLRGLEEGRVKLLDLSSQTVAQLRDHPNPKLRARALAALAAGGR